MTVVVDPESARSDSAVTTRLLVCRQDPRTREYRRLGFLDFDGMSYRFAYFRSALEQAGFWPLPGLSDAGRTHESARLFPVFTERIMSSRRPDRPAFMAALALDVDAAPFEVLLRSGGQRVGDTIEVVPVPTPDPDGGISFDFFVHGVRYLPAATHARISQLRTGEELRILHEPDNPVEPRALLVTDSDTVPLGYVPTPLLDAIDEIGDRRVTVLRANGPEVGFHFRLLVRTTGRVPSGTRPFTGPEWETVG